MQMEHCTVTVERAKTSLATLLYSRILATREFEGKIPDALMDLSKLLWKVFRTTPVTHLPGLFAAKVRDAQKGIAIARPLMPEAVDGETAAAPAAPAATAAAAAAATEPRPEMAKDSRRSIACVGSCQPQLLNCSGAW